MDVELLVIGECRGADEARRLLRTALDDIGLADTPFSVRIVDKNDPRTVPGFAGSPAFLVDGVDLFAEGTAGGWTACRVYPTADGLRNVPPLRALRKVLKEQAARAAQA